MTKCIKNSLLTIVILGVLGVIYYFNPYKIQYLGHYDKIGAHRVNSLQKLEEALPYFQAVELDLIYKENDDILDVNHPPAESIGLSFEEYVSNIKSENLPFLWLDIKNLTHENARAVQNRLLVIFNEHNYPLENVLIETLYPEALEFFKESEFKRSYYLPPGMHKKDAISLQKDIKLIDSILQEQPGIGISSYYENYPILHKKYPLKTKYLWFAGEKNSILNYKVTQKVLNDATVKFVLIPYRALKGNR